MSLDDIQVVYKEEVMGRHVYLKFPVEGETEGGTKKLMFFQGVITRFQVAHAYDNINKPLEYKHFVKFGDSDDGYYCLSDLESSGVLKWKLDEEDEEAEIPMEQENNSEVDVDSADHTISGVQFPRTVEKQEQVTSLAVLQRKTNFVTSEKNKKCITVTKKRKVDEVITVNNEATESNYLHGNNAINLEEFQHWLEDIHVGRRGTKTSRANVHSVMMRVRDLIHGYGVSYVGWKNSFRAFEGVKVDLSMDFHDLLKQAQDIEKIHGRDLGNGWLLRHPIKKLLLYQDHIKQFHNK
jgi:hypothetical protein